MKRSRAAPKRTGPKQPTPPKVAPPEGLPAWVVPAVYAAAVLALFHEFFLQGALLLGQDTYALSYFARDSYTDTVRGTGRFPLWNPLLFGGLPFVDGMHGDIFYPLSLALFFLDARTMWGWKMVLHVFLAGIFTYLFLRSLGLRRGPALFGGLVFMMGPDLVSLVYPGGDGKLFVSALAPLVFWLAERAVTGRRAGDFAFFALGIALVVFTSHMQLAYFTVWGVSLWFFFRTWQAWRAEKNTRVAGALVGAYVLAGVLGVAAAAVQFLPPLRYLQEWSHRTGRTVQAEAASAYEYSTSWSLHPEEAVSLVVPEFVGDDVATPEDPEPTYWGRNAFKLNHEYAGLVPLLLIPVLLLRRRDATTWFFLALGGLAVLYGLGATTPFFRLFYLIPGVRLFRSPSLTIFLYGLSLAVLGAMGVQRLLDRARARVEERRPVSMALWIAAGALGILALAESAGVITGIWQDIFEVDIAKLGALEANLPNIRNGFWIAFFFAAAVAGTWELLSRGLATPTAALIALLAIAAVDEYRVGRPFIRGTVAIGEGMRTSTLFLPDESITFLQQQQANGEVFRAINLGAYRQNDMAVHGIEQMNGHHGNEVGRYRTLIGGDGAANAIRLDEASGAVHVNYTTFDLTNTTYLVVGGRLPPEGPFANLDEVFVGSQSVVYRRPDALPRAFLVGQVDVVPDDRAVAHLLGETFDPRMTAVLPEPLPANITVEPGATGSAEWVERNLDAQTLRVSTDRGALLVVSDNYYPAWRATVDGREVPVLRANYTFRAVPVPRGTHEVVFRYRSPLLRGSAVASAALLGLLMFTGLWSLLRGRRGGRAE